jgi:hypothetical protein
MSLCWGFGMPVVIIRLDTHGGLHVGRAMRPRAGSRWVAWVPWVASPRRLNGLTQQAAPGGRSTCPLGRVNGRIERSSASKLHFARHPPGDEIHRVLDRVRPCRLAYAQAVIVFETEHVDGGRPRVAIRIRAHVADPECDGPRRASVSGRECRGELDHHLHLLPHSRGAEQLASVSLMRLADRRQTGEGSRSHRGSRGGSSASSWSARSRRAACCDPFSIASRGSIP